jgi:glycosyltransferase involved in cell wall biosynthesis
MYPFIPLYSSNSIQKLEAPFEKQQLTFHVIGVPYNKTSKEYGLCAFTQNTFNFCKMMKEQGHAVLHYGNEGSNPDCDENVVIFNQSEFQQYCGKFEAEWKTKHWAWKYEDDCHTHFANKVINQLEQRLPSKRQSKNGHKEFIITFWGNPLSKVFFHFQQRAIIVQAGIGYGGGMNVGYEIFGSNSHRSFYLNNNFKDQHPFLPNLFRAVIPHFIDPADFTYSKFKKNYVLFLGRLIFGKGLHTIIRATALSGDILVVAGSGSVKDIVQDCQDVKNIPHAFYPEEPLTIDECKHVVEFGYANLEQRRRLLAKAKCTMIASTYLEPFGMSMIESFISGTPVITPDHSSFWEHNLHGLTGYRCRDLNDYVLALKNIHKIKHEIVRKYGEKFSTSEIGKMYDDYFQRLNVHENTPKSLIPLYQVSNVPVDMEKKMDIEKVINDFKVLL